MPQPCTASGHAGIEHGIVVHSTWKNLVHNLTKATRSLSAEKLGRPSANAAQAAWKTNSGGLMSAMAKDATALHSSRNAEI
jgi:hypothetical protein